MNIIGIIPARMNSSRFPGKPLAKILGLPMIGHVYFRSRMSELLRGVYVATCDQEIADYVESVGGQAIMTVPTHERASDRAAEAMLKIEKIMGEKTDIAIMIQGDEPMLYPEMIGEAVQPMLENSAIDIVNLMGVLNSREEQDDPNNVKVAVDLNDFALYFSREAIPSRKKAKEEIKNIYKQVPIIPFKRDFLIKFNELASTPLEIIESVDMLRVLEHGYKVKMKLTRFNTQSVDTPQDLEKVQELMKADTLFLKYKDGML